MLLDQAVVAGVGNVFRAEALFVCGIDPARPANTLDREAFDAGWATLVAMLRKGVRQGRIATVGRTGATGTRARASRAGPAAA